METMHINMLARLAIMVVAGELDAAIYRGMKKADPKHKQYRETLKKIRHYDTSDPLARDYLEMAERQLGLRD